MPSLSEEIQADVLEAQKFSRKHMVLELDLSPDSIAALEENVDTVEYAIRGGLSEENLEMLVRIWGAYLGETLRRACGVEWVREEDGRLGVKGPAATVYPHEAVRLRLTDGEKQNLVTYFEQSRDALT